MKIQYCSDLHLEFPENWAFIKSNPLKPVGDILVLGGDILPFRIMDKYASFFDYVADHFSCTYWIPGNHEYYHSDILDRSGVLNESIRSNVFLINNKSVLLPGVRLIFSTLWTRIRPSYHYAIQQSMSDFLVIHHGKRRLLPQDYTDMHEKCLSFLRGELSLPSAVPSIVVTHHVPTFLNYPAEYAGDVLNEAFAVGLDTFIEEKGPDYWIFGHHHRNIPPFTIGKTTMLTNQLGYVRHGENSHFQNDSSIALN